ncbi:MAG: hypothetical protein IKY72_01945, partial [Bacteroidaceae bacterium]|nr:hypothetical protein [Bacteroidaceae bacterium]
YIIKKCEHRWVDDDACAHFVIVIVIVIVCDLFRVSSAARHRVEKKQSPRRRQYISAEITNRLRGDKYPQAKRNLTKQHLSPLVSPNSP